MEVEKTAEGLRLVEQVQVCLPRGAIPLLAVAALARGHQVLPHRFPSARLRQDVIERELVRRLFCAAILARVVVAQKDVSL